MTRRSTPAREVCVCVCVCACVLFAVSYPPCKTTAQKLWTAIRAWTDTVRSSLGEYIPVLLLPIKLVDDPKPKETHPCVWCGRILKTAAGLQKHKGSCKDAPPPAPAQDLQQAPAQAACPPHSHACEHGSLDHFPASSSATTDPRICAACSKTFATIARLRSHQRIHTPRFSTSSPSMRLRMEFLSVVRASV